MAWVLAGVMTPLSLYVSLYTCFISCCSMTICMLSSINTKYAKSEITRAFYVLTSRCSTCTYRTCATTEILKTIITSIRYILRCDLQHTSSALILYIVIFYSSGVMRKSRKYFQSANEDSQVEFHLIVGVTIT